MRSPVQVRLREMDDEGYVRLKRELRRRERHSRRLAQSSVNSYSQDHPGHPLGRGMPSGAPFRLDESHKEGWMRVIRQDPCSYCGGPGGTVDHIVPQSRRIRGLHDWTNFAGACESCNGSKDAMDLLAFLLVRARSRPRLSRSERPC